MNFVTFSKTASLQITDELAIVAAMIVIVETASTGLSLNLQFGIHNLPLVPT